MALKKRVLDIARDLYSESDFFLLDMLKNFYIRCNRGKISFTYYDRMHHEIHEKIISEIEDILRFRDDYEFWLYARRFEKRFANHVDTRYATGTHSGTAALQLSLTALGIGRGDEVITTPNTYIATALAISNAGARPVFVDIDEKTYNIDTDKVEDAITSRTSAIIPVHLYGLPADMNPILKIAREHGLKVIEDACQAHGAQYKGRRAGSMGDAGCFSFFTGKNLGGLGNGGIVVSNNRGFINKINAMRDPESSSPLMLSGKRTPCYLDAIQAAFLTAKLPLLERWNEKRRRNAETYNNLLKETSIMLPYEPRGFRHVYRGYAIRLNKRDKIMEGLWKRGVPTRTGYLPIHLNKLFSRLGYKPGDFPVTERCSKEILSLPVSQSLLEDEIKTVAGEIKRLNS